MARGEMTFVNYFNQPIYASAARISSERLLKQLGVAGNGAVELHLEDGRKIPLMMSADGNYVYALTSLGAHERLTASVTEVESWASAHAHCQASWDEAAAIGCIGNGLINAKYDQSGICFAYQDPLGHAETPIVERLSLRAWLDGSVKGMLSAKEALRLGLTKVDLLRAEVVDVQTTTDDTRTKLVLIKRCDDGFARDIVFSETLTMYAGQPLLEYRVVLENQSDRTVYLANMVGGEASITGYYGLLLGGDRLVVRRPSLNSDLLPPLSILSTDGERLTMLKPAQGWGEKVAYVEAPNGYGLGTSLIKRQVFSYQWHRWEISLNSFAVPLSTEESALPAPIRGGDQVEVGCALVASIPGMDGYSATLGAYDGYMTNGAPQVSSASSVYLGAVPLSFTRVVQIEEEFDSLDRWIVAKGQLQCTENGALLTGEEQALMLLAVYLDFERNPAVTVEVVRLEQDTTLDVEMILDKSRVLLLRIREPGSYEVNLKQASGWTGGNGVAIHLKAVGRRTVMVELGSLAVRPEPPPAVQLRYPLDDMEMTDLATSFSWERIDGIEDYQIQVARDPNFADLVMDGPTHLPVSHRMDLGSHHPTELLKSGVYYWRVRGISPDGIIGRWSRRQRVAVNSIHSKAEPLQAIGPDSPLFTADAFLVADLGLFKDVVPEDLRPYFAFYTTSVRDEASPAVMAPLDEYGIRKFISMWTPLVEIEHAFQNSRHVIGVWEGEQLGDIERAERIVKLCAKYGRWFHFTNGSHGRFSNQEMYAHPTFGPLLKEHSAYILFGHKTNIGSLSSTAIGAHLGAWLDGMMDQLAMLLEAWYWDWAGFGDQLDRYYGMRGGDIKKMPANFWLQQAILGVSQGVSALTFGGQTSTTGTDPMNLWTRSGVVSQTWTERILPFLRAVLARQMIPSRDEVETEIKAVVLQDISHNGPHENRLGIYDALFRNTYGLREEGEIYELIPNTGRYYWIPLMPAGSSGIPGAACLPLSQLQDSAKVRQEFDELYPPCYQGSAWVNLVGPRFFIMTTHENRSDYEDYRIQLRGLAWEMKGEVGPHTYIMGRVDDRHLWLQASTQYPERDMEICFGLEQEPFITVHPQQALSSTVWEQETQTLTVRLSHAYGVVEMELTDHQL